MTKRNIFSELAEYGIYSIPIKKASKKPVISWKKYITTAPTDDLLENWDKTSYGVAVLLGKVSNVVAIDIDDTKFSHLVPDSPAVKVGARGETRFFAFNGEPNRNYNGLEIKSTGTYAIIPPSIHPETKKAYYWTRGDLTVELPTLQSDLINNLDKHFKYTKKEKSAQDSHCGIYEPDLDDALSFIDPGTCDYDTWIKIGMAIKTTLGNSGFATWNEWSSKDTERYNAKEMPKKWDSFTLNEVTVATIFHHAEKEGFNISIPEFQTLEPTPPKSAPKLPIDQIVDTAPKLVQDLTNWILSGAYIPCKEIAFSASLAILSSYKLFKVKTESGLKSNMYILCVAGSGTGKTQALNGIKTFYENMDKPNSCSVAGTPASDAGLERILAGRKRIILWDEIGLCLKSLKNMSSYQSRVFDLLTQIYTMGDHVFVGTEYANSDGKRPTTTIHRPQISMFATTTYDPFFESLENSEIASGKYQRHFPVLCPEHVEVTEFGKGVLEITPEIKKVFAHLKKEFPMKFKSGELSKVNFLFEDVVVPFSDKARKFVNKKALELHNKMKDLPEVERAFYARIMERTQQLALVANFDSKEIRLETVQWAYATTKIMIDIFLEKGIKERFAENQTKSESNKLLKYIKNQAKWVKKSEITNRFREFPRYKREQLLEDLVEGGEVQQKNIGKAGGGIVYKA